MAKQLVRNHSHWGAFFAEVEHGRVVGVRPFEHDPDPSVLLEAIPAAVHAPTRIAQPLVREGWLADRSRRQALADSGSSGAGATAGLRGHDRFLAVPWDLALDIIAGEINRVSKRHGNAAIMGGSQGWGSAGIFHQARAQLHRFLGACGGFVDQTTNYSFGTALAFLPHVLGSAQAVTGPLTSWSSIVRHGRLMVMFGGANPKNTQVSKGGCASHTTAGALRELAAAGVEIVNISPVRDDGPEAARAAWIPIRPNTDTALMLAMTYTLVHEGRHDAAFLARYCTGFDRLLPYLSGESDGVRKDAAWASAITAVPAETITALARRMAATRTMVTATWSLQRADHGEQPYWALILLAAALGQIGLPGSGLGFGYGSAAGIADPPLLFREPVLDPVANPARLAIPAARIADCLLHPGEAYDFNGTRHRYPDIRLVYWAGGNPFHHHQDINRLRRAWTKPQTIIVQDPWWTATARHADIVLPATTTLERNDIGAAGRDRFVIAMHKAIDPVGEARNDFDIFRGLAARLGCEDGFANGRDENAWLHHIYEKWRHGARTNQAALPHFAEFWRQGYFEIPRRAGDYVLFEDFRADPDRHRLRTPSGKIELYSERIAGFGYDDCPPHPTWIAPAEWLGAADRDYPLHLVSSQPKLRLHSQMDTGPVSARGKVAGREAVLINPADAAPRGIAPGAVVRIHNRRGACLAGAVITDAVRPGVVQLSCGAWYDPQDGDAAALCRHGNANVLTRDHGTSKLAQGPSCATTTVEIERYSDVPPQVGSFVPSIVSPRR